MAMADFIAGVKLFDTDPLGAIFGQYKQLFECIHNK